MFRSPRRLVEISSVLSEANDETLPHYSFAGRVCSQLVPSNRPRNKAWVSLKLKTFFGEEYACNFIPRGDPNLNSHCCLDWIATSQTQRARNRNRSPDIRKPVTMLLIHPAIALPNHDQWTWKCTVSSGSLSASHITDKVNQSMKRDLDYSSGHEYSCD